MRERAPFDIARATQSDVEGALERLGAEELRSFVRDAVADDTSRESLADAFLDLAAKKLGGITWGEPDPQLVADAERWTKATKRALRFDISDCSTLFSRARRALLCGRASEARRCYETVIGLLAELEDASRADAPQPSSARFDRLVTPTVFGSYLVSVYEDATEDERVQSILDAVVRLSVLGSATAPLKLLEETAIRPLERFPDFMRAWTRTLEAQAGDDPAPSGFAWSLTEALLAEALERIEGLEGVARMARRARDLTHYRTYILRLADQAQWEAALDVVEEASSSLGDARERAIVLDAGTRIAIGWGDLPRAADLSRRAFLGDPAFARLLRWLLVDEPDRSILEARVREVRQQHDVLTPRMRALLASMEGAVGEVASLLDESDARWEDEENPGPIAFPALLVAFYGGPKGTPIAARICAPLFGARSAEMEWLAGAFGGPSAVTEEWPSSPPPSEDGEGVPGSRPGPAIVEALHDHDISTDLEVVPDVLRIAAAKRADLALANKDRGMYAGVALLAVAAAEATFSGGHPDVAREYLADLASAGARQGGFRGALTRTLAKSALVNAL